MNLLYFRPQKILFIGFLVLFIISLYFLLGNQIYQQSIIANYKSHHMGINETKVILLWNEFFDYENWKLPSNLMGPRYFEEWSCPVTNCIVTTNRTFLKSADLYNAVVFHAASIFPVLYPRPFVRTPDQLYVFVSQESPATTKHYLKDESFFYNLTMTYRLDSDVIFPYGYFRDKRTHQIIAPNLKPNWIEPNKTYTNQKLLKKIQGKTKTAAWFASNCNTLSWRENLVRDIQMFMDVDVYGKCGNLTCSRYSPECDAFLNNDYKFYFSFENALCKDYITEKVFEQMERDIIPVVFGGANYNKFLPPHSYIDVEQFSNVRTLVEFLERLGGSPEEYVKYFWWKEHYELTFVQPYCKLCEILNRPGLKEEVHIVKNIEEWWYGGQCRVRSKVFFV